MQLDSRIGFVVSHSFNTFLKSSVRIYDFSSEQVFFQTKKPQKPEQYDQFDAIDSILDRTFHICSVDNNRNQIFDVKLISKMH